MKAELFSIISVVAIGASLWWVMVNFTKAPIVNSENPVVNQLSTKILNIK